ncbi:MAG: PAS domain S-box protein, partial [Halanaeroarchaeum sp.]
VTVEDEVASQRRTFRKLHSVATQMVGAEFEQGVFYLAIDAAENILEFDSCSIDVVDDGYFHPVATSSRIPESVSRKLPVEDGIAGVTFEENRSIVVDDVRENDAARTVDDSFRSILSVPIDDVGVFQAATSDTDAFDESDADLAELLMSYVSQTISRIRSERAVRENEERYRTLVEQSHDAVLTIRDTTVEFANRRATEMWGYDREELVAMSVWDLVHPDDRDRIRRRGDDLRHGLRENMTFDTRIVRSDGDVRYCEFSVTRIEYRDDLVAMATARDVTERRAYERRLERQNDRLEEFASVVSHDLRNPLNVASGRMALANETGDVSHLEDATEALERMDAVIADVLTWARQGKTVDAPEDVDVYAVAKRAWETVDTRAASISSPDDEELVVAADERRLRRLFENLFRNSVEHGGDDVTVTVGPLENGFFVEDDGVGIPESDLDDVFARGFTNAESGTGFGLAIVRDIVDAHDWSIEAVETASGARFEIRETTRP